MKLDAVALVQDWVRDVGSQAGLTASNAQILSGAVGVPESRLEACRAAFYCLENLVLPRLLGKGVVHGGHGLWCFACDGMSRR